MATYQVIKCAKCKGTGKGEHPNSFCPICIGKKDVMACFKCGYVGFYINQTKTCGHCEEVHDPTNIPCSHDEYYKMRLNNGFYCTSCDTIIGFDTRRCAHTLIREASNGILCTLCSDVLEYTGKKKEEKKKEEEKKEENDDSDSDSPPPQPYRSKRRRYVGWSGV